VSDGHWKLVKKSPGHRHRDGFGELGRKYNRKSPDTASVAPKYCKIMVIWRHIPYNRRFVFGASKTVYSATEGRFFSARPL
jgi:hypothetical protein